MLVEAAIGDEAEIGWEERDTKSDKISTDELDTIGSEKVDEKTAVVEFVVEGTASLEFVVSEDN